MAPLELPLPLALHCRPLAAGCYSLQRRSGKTVPGAPAFKPPQAHGSACLNHDRHDRVIQFSEAGVAVFVSVKCTSRRIRNTQAARRAPPRGCCCCYCSSGLTPRTTAAMRHGHLRRHPCVAIACWTVHTARCEAIHLLRVSRRGELQKIRRRATYPALAASARSRPNKLESCVQVARSITIPTTPIPYVWPVANGSYTAVLASSLRQAPPVDTTPVLIAFGGVLLAVAIIIWTAIFHRAMFSNAVLFFWCAGLFVFHARPIVMHNNC